MKKRLIKKKIRYMSDSELCEHVAYGCRYWRHFAEIEFDKRLLNNWFSIKDWKEINVGYLE